MKADPRVTAEADAEALRRSLALKLAYADPRVEYIETRGPRLILRARLLNRSLLRHLAQWPAMMTPFGIAAGYLLAGVVFGFAVVAWLVRLILPYTAEETEQTVAPPAQPKISPTVSAPPAPPTLGASVNHEPVPVASASPIAAAPAASGIDPIAIAATARVPGVVDASTAIHLDAERLVERLVTNINGMGDTSPSTAEVSVSLLGQPLATVKLL